MQGYLWIKYLTSNSESELLTKSQGRPLIIDKVSINKFLKMLSF